MEEKLNHSPCDFICRYIGTLYPKTNHNVLEIPGEFKNIENTDGFLLNGQVLFMDGVESIILNKDNTTKDYATCIEYLTTEINPKVENLFDYNLAIVIQLKKYCYNVVVTNNKPKHNEITYFVDGHPVHVLFRVFDKEEIYKSLNTLSQKDYSKNKMPLEDVVKFSYCIAFAKGNYAKDYLEKSTQLFCSIEQIDTPQRLDLFMALKEKIKYHFDDDENKKMELITMITKALTDPDFVELPRNEQIRIRLQLKDETIQKMDETIQEKDRTISKLKEEIKLLKNSL